MTRDDVPLPLAIPFVLLVVVPLWVLREVACLLLLGRPARYYPRGLSDADVDAWHRHRRAERAARARARAAS